MGRPEALVPWSEMRNDQGKKKPNNEDAVDRWEPAEAEERRRLGYLYVLADGVGGAARGEKASRQAVDRILHYYAESEETDIRDRLSGAVLAANAEIFEYNATHSDQREMLTTIVACVIRGNELVGANVGDSRAYLIRDEKMRQLSEDHTEVADLIRQGMLSEEEARDYPRKNLVLRVLGREASAHPFCFGEGLRVGDAVLLCSDGLSAYIDNGKIGEAEVVRVTTRKDPVEAADDLIEMANDAGGKDNISVIVAQMHPSEEPRRIQSASAAPKRVFKDSTAPLSQQRLLVVAGVAGILIAFLIGLAMAISILAESGLIAVNTPSPVAAATVTHTAIPATAVAQVLPPATPSQPDVTKSVAPTSTTAPTVVPATRTPATPIPSGTPTALLTATTPPSIKADESITVTLGYDVGLHNAVGSGAFDSLRSGEIVTASCVSKGDAKISDKWVWISWRQGALTGWIHAYQLITPDQSKLAGLKVSTDDVKCP